MNNYYEPNANNCILNCTIADPNCKNCTGSSSSIQCSDCNTNYVLNSTSFICVIDCSPTQPNCLTCQSVTVCQTCLSGYVKSATGKCDTCDVGLKMTNGKCDSCLDGYFNNSGVCTACNS